MKITGILVVLSFFLDCSESRATSYCPTPVIKNGKYRYRQRAKFVKYSCNVGFLLYGDRYNNCHHGKWDGPPPKCVRPGCKKVTTPPNGMIYPSHIWAVLHFYCKSGFEIHGPNVTYCDGTQWSSSKPICINSNTKPPLSCDFEQEDLCGWTHDLNHDFDWRRMQFSTPSGAIGTGPSHDHTHGNGKGGYYMYIESSSKNENDTARLVSPVYEKTSEDTCFVFYYHMYGSTIGTLRTYMRMINETWSFKPSKAFFELKGNQGDRWIRSVHLFEGIPNDYQIIIEGVRGNGYVSDIAIDDVSIVENCNLADFEDEDISTTTEIEEYSTTDFLPDDLYSCEGRCYSSEIQMGRHRTCACDEGCYDRNECCPDYIDFCLIHATSDQPMETTDTLPPSTIQTTNQNISSPTPILTTSALKTTTSLKTITPLKTITSFKPTTSFKPPSSTHNYPKPEKSTTITSTTKTSTSSTKTVVFEETTTKSLPKETTMKITEKPTAATAGMTEEPNFETDSEEVTDISNDIPNYVNDIEDLEDVAHLKRGSQEKVIIRKIQEEEGVSLVYILLSVCVVVAGLLFLVVRRRKQGRSRRFRSGSQVGSASDVRFLTNDEILDLNLDYE